MKQRFFLVLIFALLALALVTLEFQLRYSQIEFRATADMADALYIVRTSHSQAKRP